MDAKRLEELVNFATEVYADGLNERDYADLRDLARCAAAWAKVELARGYGRLYVNQKTVTWFQGDDDFANGPTAIAAVEVAPEVKP